jgi:hypothetical protein
MRRPQAQEYMRKLRREIALAETERRDASDLRKRFAALDRDRRTTGAFYRCP